MAELICPNCGSHVVLPEHSSACVGTTLSKDSAGTYYLNMKENTNNNIIKENKAMTKAEQRMNTLRNSGADMSKYFTIKLPTGDDMVMEMVNGIPTPLIDDPDPVVEKIYANGYVKNSMLHRRWVLAQMWQMLNFKSWRSGKVGYENALRAKGYMYQWHTLMDELHVLSVLEKTDKEAFDIRSKFFTKEVAIGCMTDFYTKLYDHVNQLPVKKCKGVPYKKVSGNNYFVADLNKKLFDPILTKINYIKNEAVDSPVAFAYDRLEVLTRKFYRQFVKQYKLPYDTKMCDLFKDAYKGSGAYYSLWNLILFHDCKLDGFSGQWAMDNVNAFVNSDQYAPYKLFAIMKKCINDNNWHPNW